MYPGLSFRRGAGARCIIVLAPPRGGANEAWRNFSPAQGLPGTVESEPRTCAATVCALATVWGCLSTGMNTIKMKTYVFKMAGNI